MRQHSYKKRNINNQSKKLAALPTALYFLLHPPQKLFTVASGVLPILKVSNVLAVQLVC